MGFMGDRQWTGKTHRQLGKILAWVILVLLSLSLHVWGLERFNTLVFDEVYYPKFAVQFLEDQPSFSGHPPLGTYLTALGIHLAVHTPLNQIGGQNGLAGWLLSPISYRWLMALVGSSLPLAIAYLAQQMTGRSRVAWLAGLLASWDGLLLVESRYALINVYMLWFGVMGVALFLHGLSRQNQGGRSLLWVISGVCLGAAVGVKWNGAGFLLTVYGLWVMAYSSAKLLNVSHPSSDAPVHEGRSLRSHLAPAIMRLASVSPLTLGLYYGGIPAMIYWVLWQPMIALDPRKNFWQWQQQMLTYHQHLGGSDIHPYCSAWYSWPLMWRPIAYFYEVGHQPDAPATIVGPDLPRTAVQVIYAVYAMGNPLLWWLGAGAIAFTGLTLVVWLLQQYGACPPWFNLSTLGGRGAVRDLPLWPIAVAVGYGANWLPWAMVERCTFIYHYSSALVFAVVALAAWGDRCLDHPPSRPPGAIAILAIGISFVFWLPIYLGLPLPPPLMPLWFWFPQWI